MRLYKLTNSTECHNGYHYHNGFHKEPFTPSDFTKGGFTFCNEATLLRIANSNSYTFIRQVEIPENAKVFIGKTMKTDSFILGERKTFEISNITQFVDFCSPEVCELAVKDSPYAISYIHPQEPYAKLAVTYHPHSLKYIENKTLEVIEIALKGDPYTLEYIASPNKQHADIIYSKGCFTPLTTADADSIWGNDPKLVKFVTAHLNRK